MGLALKARENTTDCAPAVQNHLLNALNQQTSAQILPLNHVFGDPAVTA
jgi:hypothetical protein